MPKSPSARNLEDEDEKKTGGKGLDGFEWPDDVF